MKLLHINSYFSTTALYEQLHRRQLEAGLDLDIYVPIAQEFKEEQLKAQGDRTKVHRVFKQADRYIFPLKHRKIWKDLEATYDLASFDLCHAHSLFSNGWLALQIKKKYGVPYLVACRTADVASFFRLQPWLRRMGLEIIEEAEKLIFISKNTHDKVFNNYIPDRMKDSFTAKVEIIPNGIDDFWHQNRRDTAKSAPHQPIRLVSTGRIDSRKRYDELAAMVHHYSQHKHPLEFHLIGPVWQDKLLDKVMAYPEVTYYGSKSKEELVDFYQEMDIFAMISYPETFGLVYVEAMSQALPVLYTKSEGFDGYFNNYQVGVAVEANNQACFNQAMDYVLANYQTISQTAIQASQEFNWDQIHQRYLDIYHSLVP